MLLVLTGVQLVSIGLLAEMLVRTYHESQGKPTYVVKEIRPAAAPRIGSRALPAPLTARVLFLTESFHPVLGGGEQHILRLGRALAGSGMRGHGRDAPRRRALAGRGDAWTASASCASARPGPSRRGKYAMVPAALARAAAAARAATTCSSCRGTRVLGPARRCSRRARSASAWCCRPRSTAR